MQQSIVFNEMLNPVFLLPNLFFLTLFLVYKYLNEEFYSLVGPVRYMIFS